MGILRLLSAACVHSAASLTFPCCIRLWLVTEECLVTGLPILLLIQIRLWYSLKLVKMYIACISECTKDDSGTYRNIFVEWLFLFSPMCLICVFMYMKRTLLSNKLNFVDNTLKYKLQKCFISCTQSSLTMRPNSWHVSASER